MRVVGFVLMLVFDALAICLAVWLGDTYAWGLGSAASALVGAGIVLVGLVVWMAIAALG